MFFCFLKQSYRFNVFHFLRCFSSPRELEFNAYNDNGVYLCAPLCSKFRKAFNASFLSYQKSNTERGELGKKNEFWNNVRGFHFGVAAKVFLSILLGLRGFKGRVQQNRKQFISIRKKVEANRKSFTTLAIISHCSMSH